MCLDCFAAAAAVAAGDAIAVVADDAAAGAAAVISTSNNGATFPLRPTPAQLPSGNPLWLLHSRVKCARAGAVLGEGGTVGAAFENEPRPSLSLPTSLPAQFAAFALLFGSMAVSCSI